MEQACSSFWRELSEANIYIDDTPGISIMEIRAKCRKMKIEKI